MENYQMLFPCSSSSMAASGYSLSSNAQTSHDLSNNFLGDQSSNGLVGLRTENYHFMRNDNLEANKDHSQSGNIVFGGAEIEGKSGKKKGEKKVKKHKYAFQTRSQVDILDDGYRWRKYGQKAVKNNKFPRSYYRCTHQGCNVKKQVQRLTKDEGVVVTTYEGMHNHPIEKHTDNFEHILNQMQIYTPF